MMYCGCESSVFSDIAAKLSVAWSVSRVYI